MAAITSNENINYIANLNLKGLYTLYIELRNEFPNFVTKFGILQ